MQRLKRLVVQWLKPLLPKSRSKTCGDASKYPDKFKSPVFLKRSSGADPALAFLLGALVVFRLGAHIPVPGINPDRLAELFAQNKDTILAMFNMFSGGALERMSILALGIMPYITASIIVQLMTSVVPSLEALKKDGEAGRRKISQYTRQGTLVLGFVRPLACVRVWSVKVLP